MMKTKVFMTVAVILAGTILAVSLNGLGSNATLYQSEGVVVDFGGYKTSWTDVDYKEIDDPVELLVKASEKHGYTYTMGRTVSWSPYTTDPRRIPTTPPTPGACGMWRRRAHPSPGRKDTA
ncbi:hypothetical protein [Methanomethylophilus alvi]|uniref:hypothetical protein n=1 Tax=Methanomethylophilus alvi TaxID=1291540 RepID=UPI0037DC93FC